jgi:hypothetical protein
VDENNKTKSENDAKSSATNNKDEKNGSNEQEEKTELVKYDENDDDMDEGEIRGA